MRFAIPRGFSLQVTAKTGHRHTREATNVTVKNSGRRCSRPFRTRLGHRPGRGAGLSGRPITVIVPFAAGGPTDVIARIVGDHMSKTLGQTLVIENVVGAGGTTGITRAKRARNDGYTIAMGHLGTQAAAPALYPICNTIR